MLRNKRAMFFGLYLVVVTLILCGVTFMVRYQQGQDLPSELVSPAVVLDAVDGLSVFELREVELIRESAKGVNFGSGDFDDNFRVNFLAAVKADSEMKKFIFEDLAVNGRPASEAPGFFENILYPKDLTSKQGNSLIFGRANVVKTVESDTPKSRKNFFPVEFVFEFGRTYEVTKSGGSVVVEVVA
jgi:hypothetical protein